MSGMYISLMLLVYAVAGLLLPFAGAKNILPPTATLTVGNAFLAPDGFNRSAVVANGMHPGPLIKAKKGDTFNITVINKLRDSTMNRGTSIHWHGMFQKTSAWADGAGMVTQCPISPGHSFLYQFASGENAGTFWYHSHFGSQYCDGLRGPLIIYNDQDPYKTRYDVDDENTVITLADWYHVPAPSIRPGIVPGATLINGKGRTPNGPMSELAVLNVKPGKRYRFRLISISCDSNYQFSIDGHKLTIIEADGHLTCPVTVDRIQIFSGQRYSFILTANQPVGNYWIRALPNLGKDGLSTGFAGGINSAILRYAGAPVSDPHSEAEKWPVDLKETALHALNGPFAPGNPAPGAADVNLRFHLGVAPNGVQFTVNGSAYESPSVPMLLQILSGARKAEELLPKGTLYKLPRNKVVEITVPGGLVLGPHPFHLHGHAFSVIRSANSSQYNFVNPVRRDVVNIGGAESKVTIRFTTDNPGPWIFHCHIEPHLAAGLAVVFVEDVNQMSLANPVPDAWKELCPIQAALSTSETSITIITPTGLPPA